MLEIRSISISTIASRQREADVLSAKLEYRYLCDPKFRTIVELFYRHLMERMLTIDDLKEAIEVAEELMSNGQERRSLYNWKERSDEHETRSQG